VAKEQLYYKIGEACKILDIQPYVLRYWETEFPVLKPSKSKSGQRVFGEEDFALIRRIKELLYEEGFTIAGAKKKLESEIESGGPEVAAKPARAAAKKASGPAKKAAAEPSEPEDPDAGAHAAEIARLKTGIDKALEEARAILDDLAR
jgi:DNA-binding transcriptional MerR regulator